RHIPVHVGLERPARLTRLCRPDHRAAHRGHPATDTQFRSERRCDRTWRVPADDRAPDRVLCFPALLRQWHHGWCRERLILMLSVMSYNIRSALEHPRRLEALATVIEAAAPDLVALQEVDRHTIRSDHTDQTAW